MGPGQPRFANSITHFVGRFLVRSSKVVLSRSAANEALTRHATKLLASVLAQYVDSGKTSLLQWPICPGTAEFPSSGTTRLSSWRLPLVAWGCQQPGAATSRDGELREAIAEFQRASTDLLDALRLHFNLSVAYNLAGMFGEEARHNAWVVRHQPRLAAGHLALAASLSRFESYEDALSHYRTAMSLRPSLLTPELEERIRNLTLQATKHQAGPGSELQGSARAYPK